MDNSWAFYCFECIQMERMIGSRGSYGLSRCAFSTIFSIHDSFVHCFMKGENQVSKKLGTLNYVPNLGEGNSRFKGKTFIAKGWVSVYWYHHLGMISC
jgi:hypothetical protein